MSEITNPVPFQDELKRPGESSAREESKRIHGMYPLWNSDDRGKHHLVVCPDDEATAPPDDFN